MCTPDFASDPVEEWCLVGSQRSSGWVVSCWTMPCVCGFVFVAFRSVAASEAQCVCVAFDFHVGLVPGVWGLVWLPGRSSRGSAELLGCASLPFSQS